MTLPVDETTFTEMVKFIGKQLRKWADLGDFKALAATLRTADGDVVIRTDEDRRVWLTTPDGPGDDLELTALVNKRQGDF